MPRYRFRYGNQLCTVTVQAVSDTQARQMAEAELDERLKKAGREKEIPVNWKLTPVVFHFGKKLKQGA